MLTLVWLTGVASAQVACGDVLTADTTLTADVVCPPGYAGDALTLDADGIILDGAGFRLDAPDASAGVFSSGRTGVVIQNLDVSATTGVGAGIEIRNSTGFLISNVMASGREYGILGRGGTKSLSVLDTDVSDSAAFGIDVQNADAGLTLVRNVFDGSEEGLRIDGLSGPWSLPSSKADANSFAGVGLGGNAGDVLFLTGVSDVTIDGLDLSDPNGIGRSIFVSISSGVTISNNDLSGRRRGIQSNLCDDLTITGNDLSDSSNFGLLLEGQSLPLTIESNTFDNSDQGLRIDDLVGPWTFPTTNSFVGVPLSNANDDVVELQDTVDITFDGTDLSATSGMGNAVRLLRSVRTTFDGADLSGRSRGIYTQQSTEDLVVRNTDVSDSDVRALQLDELQGTLELTDVTTDGSTNGLLVSDTFGPITVDVSTVSFADTAPGNGLEWVQVLRSFDVTVTGIEALELGDTTTVVRVQESDDVVVDDVRTCEARRGVFVVDSNRTVIDNAQFGSGNDGVQVSTGSDSTTIDALFLGNATDVDDNGTNTTVTSGPMVDGDADGVADLCDACPADPLNDLDGDGLCAGKDTDDDGDGVPDKADADKDDPNACQDADKDGCDDCSVAAMAEPNNDGTDTDGDGACDVGDPDDDGDGKGDGDDSAPLDPNVCSDDDYDDCDDCTNGSYDPANDGADADGDGICDPKDLVINPSVSFDTDDVPWTTGGIGSPSVVFDPASGLFVMVFETRIGTHPDCPVGVWAIGLATSADGLTWTDAGGPLVQPTPGSGDYWECVAAHPSLVDRSSGNLVAFFKSEQSDAACGSTTETWGCGQYTGVGRVLITWDSGAGEYLATPPAPSPSLNVGDNFGYPRAIYDEAEYKVALSERPDMLVATGTATSLSLAGTPWQPGDASWTPDEVFNPAPVCEGGGEYSAFLGGRELGKGGFGDILAGNVGRVESSDFVSWTLGAGPVLSTDAGEPELRHFDALKVGTTDYLLYFSDLNGPGGTNRVGLAETSSGWAPASVQSKVCTP